MFSFKRSVEKKEKKKQEKINENLSSVKADKKKPAPTSLTISKEVKPKAKTEVSGIYATSYRLLSKRLEFMFPRLAVLENRLEMAGIPIPYQAYICAMVLLSGIAGLIGIGFGIVIGFTINMQPAEFKFVLPFFTFVAFFQATFGIMYVKPGMGIGIRRKKFAEELPYFMGYMATLASSGLTLEGIFKAIAREETEEEIVKSARLVVRNIDILGMDIITAITDLIKRSPSESFTELLDGLISTVMSGGNLKEYFTAMAKVQMEEKKLILKKMTSSLGIVAEMYTILLVVFPLMSVIMLSIMAIMQPNLMGFDIGTLMKLITYLLVPIFGIMVLMMMDGMVPKR